MTSDWYLLIFNDIKWRPRKALYSMAVIRNGELMRAGTKQEVVTNCHGGYSDVMNFWYTRRSVFHSGKSHCWCWFISVDRFLSMSVYRRPCVRRPNCLVRLGTCPSSSLTFGASDSCACVDFGGNGFLEWTVVIGQVVNKKEQRFVVLECQFHA